MVRGTKKKLSADSDLCGGNVAYLRIHLGRKPTYVEYFALYLNRQRELDRRSRAVQIGCAMAMGRQGASLEYFRNLADGEGQAKEMMGKWQAQQHLLNGR